MSKYSVGLRNVGSYMVSGQPYITGSVVNDGSEVKIEFPYVTKNVTIRIPPSPNTAALKEGGVYYLTTDIDSTAAGQDGQVPPFGIGESDWTWAFWWKSPTWNKRQVIAAVQETGSSGDGFTAKIKIGNPASAHGLQLELIDIGVTNYTAQNLFNNTTLTNDKWYHLALTQKTGSTHLYINGFLDSGGKLSQQISSSADVRFGWNSHTLQLHTASFDESIFFHTGMGHAEIKELYNNGEWYDPRKHSQAANITCWWTMGDDHRDKYGSAILDPGFTTSLIYDVIDSSSENINLHSLGADSRVFEYVPGPFTSQTTGKLRVSPAAQYTTAMHFIDADGSGINDSYLSIPYVKDFSSDSVTIAFWFKQPGHDAPSSVTSALNTWLQFLPAGGVHASRAKIVSSVDLFVRADMNGGGAWSATLSDGCDGNWHFFAFTFAAGADQKMYYDGVFKVGNTMGGSPVSTTSLAVPYSSPVHSYSNIMLFNTALDATEINELFNGGAFLDPNLHSKSSNLEHWYRFDNTLSPPDTNQIAYDRVANNDATFVANAGGSLNARFISGPSGSNSVFPNKHYYELQGLGSSITLPMKTKELFLQGVGSQTAYEVIAELTNIPTGSMYTLSGAGIDE